MVSTMSMNPAEVAKQVVDCIALGYAATFAAMTRHSPERPCLYRAATHGRCAADQFSQIGRQQLQHVVMFDAVDADRSRC